MVLEKSILVFFVTFCFYVAFSNGSPQRCGETTIQYNSIYNNLSISIFADLKISSPNTTVTVTNVNVTAVSLGNTDTEIIFKAICAWERAGSVTICDNETLSFVVGDSNVVELQITLGYNISGFEYDETQPFYSSVVDGNSFSFYDGRLYDENNQCYNYVYQGSDVQQTLSECCTSMEPINITNSDQMCTHFTSASNITYNSDKSLYASMLLDYELKNGNVTMFGKYSGPLNWLPFLIIDDAQGCDEVLNNTIYCGYPLYPSGNKLLVFLAENVNGNQTFGFANKIIIRGNQTLMTDDKPFTQKDKCQTFNFPYDSRRTISTTSCCTIFQDINPTTTSTTLTSVSTNSSPSPTSPTPPTTSTSQSSQSSQSISVSASTVTSGSKSFLDFSFFTLTLIVSIEIFKI